METRKLLVLKVKRISVLIIRLRERELRHPPCFQRFEPLKISAFGRHVPPEAISLPIPGVLSPQSRRILALRRGAVYKRPDTISPFLTSDSLRLSPRWCRRRESLHRNGEPRSGARILRLQSKGCGPVLAGKVNPGGCGNRAVPPPGRTVLERQNTPSKRGLSQE